MHDPAHHWILISPPGCNVRTGNYSPEWRSHCPLSYFGAPNGYNEYCAGAYKITQDGAVRYSMGYPIGLSAVTTESYPAFWSSNYGGRIDATFYSILIARREYSRMLMPVSVLYRVSVHHRQYNFELPFETFIKKNTSNSAVSAHYIPLDTWTASLI
jgi:hypothetical protein